ncbi:DUF4169 family protein [Phaeobacter sp. NW0010-22]|uniref:DUF4169 family protein n=1 Tax=Phaeobacter sp. NW0010-22 TaxID=3135907 RepID=UPI00310A3567
MTQPVNLNRFRKDKARADNKARADKNAVKFGQTKTQKAANKTKLKRARQNLDRHKVEE